MNKEEFFLELADCLSGEVSDQEYKDSIDYYRGYFREQEAQGRSEQDILEELGSARLIAHSIIDAHGVDHHKSQGGAYYEEETGGSYNDAYNGGYRKPENGYRRYDSREEIVNDPEESGRESRPMRRVGGTLMLIAGLLLAGMVLHFMLPLILIIIAVIIITSMFRS